MASERVESIPFILNELSTSKLPCLFALPSDRVIVSLRRLIPISAWCGWIVALVSFHLAHSVDHFGTLILVYPIALVASSRGLSGRQAFYGGLVLGLLLYGPQLWFFYTLFQQAAVLLWMILAFWIAIFLVLCRALWGPTAGYRTWFIPFLWTGLEYFRSELYPLRFSWVNAAYPLAFTPLRFLVSGWGMYSVGFFSAAIAVAIFGWGMNFRRRVAIILALAAIWIGAAWLVSTPQRSTSIVRVAGMQLELSNPGDLAKHLDQIYAQVSDAPLIVLHEYLLEGEVPAAVAEWCRDHHRWLVVGGKKDLSNGLWQNTAFVVGPEGRVVFEQGKSVPIQFFKDGVPAQFQQLWESPWGKIGIAVCYDLSYRRVIDRLVRGGAQMLVIPTMDSMEWGSHQHWIHSMVAPLRAAEYGLPIVRVASSGISQVVDRQGEVIASAPSPGNEAILSAECRLAPSGRLPFDALLAPISVGVVAIHLLWLAASHRTRLRHSIPQVSSSR